jgi:hypothetical protein
MSNEGQGRSAVVGSFMNRRYCYHGSCATNIEVLPRCSRAQQDRGSGHCRGHRWQYLITGLPRWARTWSTSFEAFCGYDETDELADLEREAGALAAKAAAIRARLDSASREYGNHGAQSDETAGQE